MSLIAVACIDKNYGIGNGNELLVKSKRDLTNFKNLTINNTVAMGGNTLRSLPGGNPLKDRNNIVLTRNNFICEENDNLRIISRIDNFYATVLTSSFNKDVYVIGGEFVYNLFKDVYDELYITHVDKSYNADKHFFDISSRFKYMEAIDSWTDNDVNFITIKYSCK